VPAELDAFLPAKKIATVSRVVFHSAENRPVKRTEVTPIVGRRPVVSLIDRTVKSQQVLLWRAALLLVCTSEPDRLLYLPRHFHPRTRIDALESLSSNDLGGDALFGGLGVSPASKTVFSNSGQCFTARPIGHRNCVNGATETVLLKQDQSVSLRFTQDLCNLVDGKPPLRVGLANGRELRWAPQFVSVNERLQRVVGMTASSSPIRPSVLTKRFESLQRTQPFEFFANRFEFFDWANCNNRLRLTDECVQLDERSGWRNGRYVTLHLIAVLVNYAAYVEPCSRSDRHCTPKRSLVRTKLLDRCELQIPRRLEYGTANKHELQHLGAALQHLCIFGRIR